MNNLQKVLERASKRWHTSVVVYSHDVKTDTWVKWDSTKKEG